MTDDIDEWLAKLDDIDEQLAMAVLEVPADGLLSNRLRHIKLLSEYVRMGLRKMQMQQRAVEKGTDTSTGKATDSE